MRQQFWRPFALCAGAILIRIYSTVFLFLLSKFSQLTWCVFEYVLYICVLIRVASQLVDRMDREIFVF